MFLCGWFSYFHSFDPKAAFHFSTKINANYHQRPETPIRLLKYMNYIVVHLCRSHFENIRKRNEKQFVYVVISVLNNIKMTAALSIFLKTKQILSIRYSTVINHFYKP